MPGPRRLVGVEHFLFWELLLYLLFFLILRIFQGILDKGNVAVWKVAAWEPLFILAKESSHTKELIKC